jgi:superfamily II DNA or RNA helicase
MSRRRFSAIERQVLAHISDWKCSICSANLDQFHADHIAPFSKGGPTHLDNGQALCPTCNLKKGAKMNTLQIPALETWKNNARPWQNNLLQSFNSTAENFFLEACPAAGKTIASIGCALSEKVGGAKLFIVVSPSTEIQSQWQRKMAEYGIQLFIPSNKEYAMRGGHGFSLTYQGLCEPSTQTAIRSLMATKGKTFVIFDEIHHCGDPSKSSWGQSVSDCFGDVPRCRILSLTGTPFRTDKARIPFMKYKEISEAELLGVPDFTYGMLDAYKDTPCPIRKVVFKLLGSTGGWLENGVEKKASFADSIGRFDANRLAAVSLGDNAWIADALTEANRTLDEVRLSHKSAGGLIIAFDQAEARKLTSLLYRNTGESATVVLSDEPESLNRISEFREGSSKWVIAVRMIAEGVDIPRLRVGVYFSRVKTKSFFNQFVGRFTRRQPESIAGEEQDSYVLIYNHPDLNRHAQEILESIYLAQQEEPPKEPLGVEGADIERSTFVPQFAQLELDGVISAGSVHDSEMAEKAQYVASKTGLPISSVLEALQAAEEHEKEKRFPSGFYSQLPLQEEIGALRSRLTQRVNRLAYRLKIEPQDIRLQLAYRVVPIAQATKEQVEKHLELVAKWETASSWEEARAVA